MINKPKEDKFRPPRQWSAKEQSNSRSTTIRRFPRRDRRLVTLTRRLWRARYSPPDVLPVTKQLLSHLEQTYPVSTLPGFTWKDIPRFDPLSVKRMRWIIELFVAEGNIQLVFGERGSFKSTLLLRAAKAVAKGEKFLGMKTRRRRVLYLDYENPANILRARNDNFKLNLPHNQNLVIWDRFGGPPPPRPGDPDLENIVRNCIAETGHAPWIIFDSWSSLLKAGEGGEFTGQIAPIYLCLRKLADMGATVTMIDHPRKYERGTLYGGQDKEAKVDSTHTFLRFKNKARPNNPIVRVESWLKRCAPEGEGSFAFEVQSEIDEKGNWHILDIIPARNPIEAEAANNIGLLRNLIKENPTCGQEALAKRASGQGIPRDQAIELLKEGDGKHWKVVKDSHNRNSYSVLKN